MQKSFFKNVFRTIGGSIGRYIALICIVMLGVIFYVGLEISTVDMIDTANDYYNTGNFYDYSLVSTLGFDTKDVFDLRDDGRMFNVEGAYYQDMIVSDDVNSNYVVRIHTITENINKLSLISGRMPETADECVVDGRYYDESIIGKKIVVSGENSRESLDNMVYEELTVTGLVDSPLYLSYQRGTTSVGDGSINSFVYVNFECFGIDYYSQLYIDIEDGYYIYSDDYKSLIESRQEEMEEFSLELAELRYNRLSDELEQGKAEYNNALAEYEESLAQYEDGLYEYNYAVAMNNGQKAQLEGITDNYNRLLDLKQQYLDEYNYYAAYSLDPQLNSLKGSITGLEVAIQMTDEALAETKSQLDETKKMLDEAAVELDENVEILETEIAEVKAYALTRDDNTGYSSYKDNADIVASIAYLFPVFFVLVASLVCVTTMSRMIEEERTQIGVFKALGYRKRTIFGKYIFYSLSATIIGAVLGFYIGSYLFPTVIWQAYMMMYTYTDSLNIIHDYSLLALSMGVAVVVLVGSTIFTCYKVLTEVPAEMIRPKAPEPGKRVFLEKIKFIWNRLPFLHKVSIRNCFRYKKRFFMMLIGIAGCTALLIIGLGLQDSISSVCNDQYDRVETYDYLIAVNEDLDDKQITAIQSEINNISEGSVSIAMNTADIKLGDEKKSVSLITSSDLTKLDGFINISDEKGKILLGNDAECIISENLAESLGASKGDTVTLSFENLQESTYIVAGVYENYVQNYVFVSETGYINGSGEEPYYNCFLANISEDTDVYEKLTELSSIEEVSNVTATQSTRDYFNDMIKSLDAVVYLVILCAAVLAFVVLYNLNNINIMERIREIATIKVLGFFRNETSGYVFRENVILVILGTLCGLPLGYVMHQAVMSKIKVDMICFDIHIDVSSYLISAGLTILFSIFVEMFMRRKISEVNMSESLKSIE